MAKKRKLTSNQKEYKKNLRRIKSYIRKYEKIGFEFEFKIPEMPKRVTQKQLRLIREINPKTLSDKAFIINYQTGESLNISQYKRYIGEERRKIKRELERPITDAFTPPPPISIDAQYNRIIDNFRELLRQLPPRTASTLTRLLDSSLQTSDIEDVAKAIEGSSVEFKKLFERLMGDSDGASIEYSSAFIGKLQGVTNDTKMEMEEEFFSYMHGV